MKRLRGQMAAALLGGLFGAFVQLLLNVKETPVIGFVIGALVFFGLNEAMRD